jgi:hypothetical protein
MATGAGSPQEAGQAAAPEQEGLLAAGTAVLNEALGLAAATLDLAEAETRHSAASLVGMMGNGLMFALLLTCAWLALLAAAVLALIGWGCPASLGMVLGGLANLALALLALARFRAHERGLGWGRTLHVLRGQSVAGAAPDASD